MADNKTSKIGRYLFISILGLQALIELGISTTLLFNFQVALETGFGISYSSELDILGMALGLYLLLLTTLMVLSMVWTLKSYQSGITLGIVVGIFLSIFGVLTYIKFGDTQGLLVDSLRGILTIIFGYMAYQEIKK